MNRKQQVGEVKLLGNGDFVQFTVCDYEVMEHNNWHLVTVRISQISEIVEFEPSEWRKEKECMVVMNDGNVYEAICRYSDFVDLITNKNNRETNT